MARNSPVAKELREDLWNRFKDASTEVNKRYQSFFEARKEVERKNEEAKIALCEEIESMDLSLLTSFCSMGRCYEASSRFTG